MSKKDGGCVTHAECSAVMGPLQTSLSRIENAIIGPDLSSGLVKKVADLDAKVDSIVKNNTHEKGEQAKKDKKQDKWKLAALTFGFSLLIIFIKEGIDCI